MHPPRWQMHRVCTLVALRSARLVAAALLGILQHTGWAQVGAEGGPGPEEQCIVFDGGVYSSWPGYRRMLQAALLELLGGCLGGGEGGGGGYRRVLQAALLELLGEGGRMCVWGSVELLGERGCMCDCACVGGGECGAAG